MWRGQEVAWRILSAEGVVVWRGEAVPVWATLCSWGYIHAVIYIPIHPHTHPCIYASIHLSRHVFIHEFTHPCTHPCIYPCTHPSPMWTSTLHLCMHPHTYACIHVPIISAPIHPCPIASIAHIHIPKYPSVYPLTHPCTHKPISYPCAHLVPICASMCPSIHLCVQQTFTDSVLHARHTSLHLLDLLAAYITINHFFLLKMFSFLGCQESTVSRIYSSSPQITLPLFLVNSTVSLAFGLEIWESFWFQPHPHSSHAMCPQVRLILSPKHTSKSVHFSPLGALFLPGWLQQLLNLVSFLSDLCHSVPSAFGARLIS